VWCGLSVVEISKTQMVSLAAEDIELNRIELYGRQLNNCRRHDIIKNRDVFVSK
jgi:hypothetical protein